MHQKDLMLRDYVQGMTVADVARKYDIPERSAMAHIRAAASEMGVAISAYPNRGGLQREELVVSAELAAAYRAGLVTADDISRATGASRFQVGVALERAGVVGIRPTRIRDDQGRLVKNPFYDMKAPGNLYEQVYDLYITKNMPGPQVGRILGIAATKVAVYARRWGEYKKIPTNKGSGNQPWRHKEKKE